MGRDIFDIKEFKYGVISAVDEEDIPSESASDSLNIDGDVGEGVLQSIPTDTEFTVGGSSLANVRNGEFIHIGTEHHLIYHDSSANAICAIMDFYNVASLKKKLILVSSLTASKQVSFTPNKSQVHIGVQDGTSKYIGYADHGIFNKGRSWTVSGTSNDGGEVRVFVTAEHGLKDGDVVKITGVDSGATIVNGYWLVKSAVNYDAGATNASFIISGSTYDEAWSSGGTVEYTLIVGDSNCANIAGDSSGTMGFPASGGIAEATAGDGYFLADTYHEWRLSFIYDGLEESPLYAYPNSSGFSDTASATIPYYELLLKAYNANLTAGNQTYPTGFSRRLTGVNIYRADSNDNVPGNIGLSRKVASLDINSSTYWQASTNDLAVYLRDYGSYTVISTSGGASFTTSSTVISESVTYRENSGLPETLTATGLTWALSAQGNGYHFVGLPYAAYIPSGNIIYRSKNFRYDIFDWTADFLILPEKPTAMEFYEGRLYAFSSYKTYRINPELLVIEDIFEDAGAQGQRAVHSNEYGMFFANATNAWMYSGGQFSRIGDAIRQSASGGKSWKTFAFSTLTNLIVDSEGQKGYVTFVNEYEASGKKILCWAYHPLKKRWDVWSFGTYASSANDGIIKGKDGELYYSGSSKTYELMSNSSYQAWEWYSQDLTFRSTRQNKSITMIKIDATGTVSINYGFEGATVNTAYTNEALINQYKKSIRIKLNAASGTNSVDSLEVIYRNLIGAR